MQHHSSSAQSTPSAASSIGQLRSGLRDLSLVFIVLDVGRATTTKEARIEVRTVRVADKSGSINFSCWGEKGRFVQPGDILRLTKGYTTMFKGCLTLYVAKNGILERIGDFRLVFSELPFMSEYNAQDASAVKPSYSPSSSGSGSGSGQSPFAGGSSMGTGGSPSSSTAINTSAGTANSASFSGGNSITLSVRTESVSSDAGNKSHLKFHHRNQPGHRENESTPLSNELGMNGSRKGTADGVVGASSSSMHGSAVVTVSSGRLPLMETQQQQHRPHSLAYGTQQHLQSNRKPVGRDKHQLGNHHQQHQLGNHHQQHQLVAWEQSQSARRTR